MDVDKAMKSTDESKAAELGPSEHMVINPELAIGIIGCNVELEDIEPNFEPVDDKEAADVEPLGYVEEFDMEEASGGSTSQRPMESSSVSMSVCVLLSNDILRKTMCLFF
jgi:hypothetical protein